MPVRSTELEAGEGVRTGGVVARAEVLIVFPLRRLLADVERLVRDGALPRAVAVVPQRLLEVVLEAVELSGGT